MHSRSLTVRLQPKLKVRRSRDCARVLRNLEIGCAISRLERNPTISENAQRYLEIAQIFKLRGTYILGARISKQVL